MRDPDHSRPSPPLALLFTGHRIDEPDRERPRFPAAAEERAQRMIDQAVAAERARAPGRAVGLAGAASGGDILFHEACAARGVESRIYLALPVEEYEAESVAGAGARWLERYRRLCATRPVAVLPDSEGPAELSVWERTNLWLLDAAFALRAERTALLALWDGRGGDGPGGTADMVRRAQRRGARTRILDARVLARS